MLSHGLVCVLFSLFIFILFMLSLFIFILFMLSLFPYTQRMHTPTTKMLHMVCCCLIYCMVYEYPLLISCIVVCTMHNVQEYILLCFSSTTLLIIHTNNYQTHINPTDNKHPQRSSHTITITKTPMAQEMQLHSHHPLCDQNQPHAPPQWQQQLLRQLPQQVASP